MKKYIGRVSFVFSTAQGRVRWETFSSLIQQMLLKASWVLGTSHVLQGPLVERVTWMDKYRWGDLTELGVVRASHTGGKTWPGEGRSGVEAEGLGAGPGLQVPEHHGDSGGQNA